jgi:regulator of RNase E activity RraA
MPEWNSDEQLFALIRGELYSAVVGDICDSTGLRNQYLPAALRPLDRQSRMVLCGRAMTVQEEDIQGVADESQPWGRMLEALDSLRPDEIYVCAGASPAYALFGELMATAARNRGAAGAICDGFVRDTHQIIALGFPVFCHGSHGCDQRGRGTVRDYRVPLHIGQVLIQPGDLLVGDVDGVVIAPRDAEVEIFTKALAKARAESVVRQALLRGMSASEAFAQYGVL